MAGSAYDILSHLIVLRRDNKVPLQEQLVAFFRDSIRHGRLHAGSRLPSSRRLAARLSVSRTTVVEAYERLATLGYAEARPRAGVFVAPSAGADGSGAAGAHARAAAPRAAVSPAGRIDPVPAGYHLPLAPGVPAIDRFPSRLWSELFAQLLGSAAERIVAWGDPKGEWALRKAIAEYLESARGIRCGPGQVIVASGSQPLVETIVRAAVAPGDGVWFEEPGDPASRAVLDALGLETIPVPVDEQGLDVDAGLRSAPGARLALVAPSHHYPLGHSMSVARRRALLEWADRRGAWIIENEIDGDYRFVPQMHPTLHALDIAERVIYLGSFNKALAPGLRVGYAVLPRELAAKVRIMAATVCVATQLLLASFWSSGHLAAHFRLLRDVHARRRRLLVNALRGELPGLLDATPLPEAGLRLPLGLSSGCSDAAVARGCLAAGIKVGRPFSSCYSRSERTSGVTIGFASTPEERIRPAVAKLASIIRAAGPGPRRRFA